MWLNIKYPEHIITSTISSIIASGIVRLINPPKQPQSSSIIPFVFTYTKNARKNTKTLKTNRMAIVRNRFVNTINARAISKFESKITSILEKSYETPNVITSAFTAPAGSNSFPIPDAKNISAKTAMNICEYILLMYNNYYESYFNFYQSYRLSADSTIWKVTGSPNSKSNLIFW